MNTPEDSDSPAEARDWVWLVAHRQQAQIARALGDVEHLVSAQGAEAYCLECGPVQPARMVRGNGGLSLPLRLLLWLKAW